ncbi:MAG: PQQ-binding-like beta-propeller repeat protein [Gemmatimonas sp.]
MIRSSSLLRLGVASIVAAGLLAVAACGGSSQPKLKGERIPVLLFDPTLKPDPALAAEGVSLTRPYANADWPQVGGAPSHAMEHVALNDVPKRVWSAGIGEGSDDQRKLLAQPVVADGKIFTLDAVAEARAYRAADGRRLWRAELLPTQESGGGTMGGGIAYDEGRLYVTTGFSDVVALDAETGKEIWRRRVSGPSRAAPTVADGRVFVTTVESRTHALAADDGRQLWTHDGTSEVSGFLGGASPAVSEGIVVVAYPSGEIFGIRADSGRQVWSEFLPLPSRTSQASDLADIRAAPVIYQGTVFAISNSGRMAAINLRSGARQWEQRIGSIQPPWVDGDNVFVVTSDAEIACLNRRDGRVRWVRSLPRWENEKKKRDPIAWTGPVLAGDRLILAGSQSMAVAISPYTGDLLGQVEMPDPISIPPAIADKTAFFVTDDADLVALR